jgi:hypothetical protein
MQEFHSIGRRFAFVDPVVGIVQGLYHFIEKKRIISKKEVISLQ